MSRYDEGQVENLIRAVAAREVIKREHDIRMEIGRRGDTSMQMTATHPLAVKLERAEEDVRAALRPFLLGSKH